MSKLTRGKRAVRSFAAENELADILVHIVAKARAAEAKKAAGRLSHWSINSRGSLGPSRV